jgi:hypothetical protein
MGIESWHEGSELGSGQEVGRAIDDGIEMAIRQGRWIDDVTAKRIARLIEPGSGALREFFQTGAIVPGIASELAAAATETAQRQMWAEELGSYCQHRRRKDAIPYWNEAGME